MRDHQIRQCIACRERDEKEIFFRVCWQVDEQNQGKLVEGIQSGEGGRAFYLHQSTVCTAKKIDANRVARALRLAQSTLTNEAVQQFFAGLHRQVIEKAIG